VYATGAAAVDPSVAPPKIVAESRIAQYHRLSAARAIGAHHETVHQTRPGLRRGGPVQASRLVGRRASPQSQTFPDRHHTLVETRRGSTAGHFPRMALSVKGHFSESALHHILCGPTTCGIDGLMFRASAMTRSRAQAQRSSGNQPYLVVGDRRSME
jgi:hypothetical protein